MAVVGVIGLGVMGLGIAQVFAAAGLEVLVTDAMEAARLTARDRILAALEPRVTAGKLTPEARDAALARITVVDGPEVMGAADLVLEAVVERIEVKRDLFARLEQVLSPDAVLATNTSSLSVAEMAPGLCHPERLLGLHFFNPAPVMKLVELVALPGTAPEALVLARSLAEAAGKVVVQCADRPGFIVNRCARPFYGEALALHEEGRSAAEIDASMLAAGYRLGPFSLIDLVGADINLAATESLNAAMGGHPRYRIFQAQRDRLTSGDLGRKTGKGWLFPDLPGAAPEDATAITHRIEAMVVNEAGWLLEEGATTREGIDTAMKLGMNFPRGPFEMQARIGPVRVLEILAGLEATAAPEFRARYQPAPVLRG